MGLEQINGNGLVALLIVFWLTPCFLVSIMSSHRKINGVSLFFISFLFSPIIGVIVALLCPSRRRIEFEQKQLEKQDRIIELMEQQRQLSDKPNMPHHGYASTT